MTSKAVQTAEVQSATEQMQTAIASLALRDEMAAKIEEMQGELFEDAKDEIEEQTSRVAKLEEELEEYDDRVVNFGQIQDLARVRTAIKSGRYDEGREALERVLSELDSGWRQFM